MIQPRANRPSSPALPRRLWCGVCVCVCVWLPGAARVYGTDHPGGNPYGGTGFKDEVRKKEARFQKKKECVVELNPASLHRLP